MSQLGDEVSRRRKELKLTVRAFAEKTGLSLGYIGYLESGSRYPTNPSVLMKIADALELNEEEKNKFYDLVAKERTNIPADVMTYVETSEMAKTALRVAKEEKITDDLWKKIIKRMKEGD